MSFPVVFQHAISLLQHQSHSLDRVEGSSAADQSACTLGAVHKMGMDSQANLHFEGLCGKCFGEL